MFHPARNCRLIGLGLLTFVVLSCACGGGGGHDTERTPAPVNTIGRGEIKSATLLKT